MEKVGDQLQHRQTTVVKAVNLVYMGNFIRATKHVCAGFMNREVDIGL